MKAGLGATMPKKSALRGMSFHARSRPTESERAEPGERGMGQYYRIVVQPEELFSMFRTQDVSEQGGMQRLAGKRKSGNWATQAWLVSKNAAHIEGRKLVADNQAVHDLIRQLGMDPIHEHGDIFIANVEAKIAEKSHPIRAEPYLHAL
jgi:hypothetical protein